MLSLAIPDLKLDLHGRTAREAERILRNGFMTWRRSHRGKVVEIVTGRGLGSPGDPVLKSLVRDLLNEEFTSEIEEWASGHGGGSFKVRIK